MLSLRRLFSRKSESKTTPLLTEEQEREIQVALNPPPPRAQPKGRVIKQTRSAEFNPIPSSGGRVVKVMPRPLQKIKFDQEKFEKDEVPRIED